ncbi:hypothetical protein CVS40_8061 [Lucilia cuprina]|nr:hypothetical protein CVS40_8061 [Lucilia cuprina]
MERELLELRRLRFYLNKSKQRIRHMFRERPDHFEQWIDTEFHKSARMVLERINSKLTYVVQSLQLLVTIRFYATGSFQITVADFQGYIKLRLAELLEKKKFCPPKQIGALYCTHVKTTSPDYCIEGGEFAEIFRNRKGYYSINVVCDASLLFTDIVARWLKFRFESGSRDNQIILGDGGYAGYDPSTYLMIPLDNPRSCAEKLYNESQIRTRNLIKRCFGIWKRGFPILSMGLRVNLSKTQDIKSAIF